MKKSNPGVKPKGILYNITGALDTLMCGLTLCSAGQAAHLGHGTVAGLMAAAAVVWLVLAVVEFKRPR